MWQKFVLEVLVRTCEQLPNCDPDRLRQIVAETLFITPEMVDHAIATELSRA